MILVEEGEKLLNSIEDSLFVCRRALLDLQSGIPFKDCPWAGGMQGISAPGSYTLASGDTTKIRKDVIFHEVGTYVSDNQGVIYPFAGLMREEVRGIEYGDGVTTVRSDLVPLSGTRSDLLIPGWKVGEIVRIEYRDGEAVPAYFVNGEPGPRFLGRETPEEGKSYIVARVNEGEEWEEYLSEQKFDLQGVSLKVKVPSEPQIYDFGEDGQGTVGNCDVLKRGLATKDGNKYGADERGAACDYVLMKELDTRLSYLMRVQGENVEGRSVKFFLYNTGSKRNDIEYLLGKDKFDQTFSLLPWSWDGYYTLNIETRSFGQRTENMVEPVEARWFPIEQIAGAKLVDRRETLDARIQNNLKIMVVRKTGTWLYRVRVEGSGLLRLSQGYDEGWISLDLQHVKVDGWANGWMVPGSGTATIFYWPQLLEYIGFVFLGLTAWIVFKSISFLC